MGEQNSIGVVMMQDGGKITVGGISGERTISIPWLRRMSRKRFIKLCMAHGVNRNEARDVADFLVCMRRNDQLQNELFKLFGSLERLKSVSYALAAWRLNLYGGKEA